jgi:hypothetical protein
MPYSCSLSKSVQFTNPASTIVGHFQVMAVLQAARAHALGLPADSSFSWGLNRAIFYESQERGVVAGRPHDQRGPSARGQRKHLATEVYSLGDEAVFEDQSLGKAWEPRFTIDGKVQTLEDFDKEVRSRFGVVFDQVWSEALDLVCSLPRETLSSRSAFFDSVYMARRDELCAKWAAMVRVRASGRVAGSRR